MIQPDLVDGQDSYKLKNGRTVTLGDPMLVRRSRRFCWFPTLIPLSDGCIAAMMSAYGDIHVSSTAAYLSLSRDGGMSWDEPRILIDAGWSNLRLASGETLILPYYLRPRPGGMGAPANKLGPDGQHEYLPCGVTITGWPRKDRPFSTEIGTTGFVGNGQTVALKDGSWLATWYGFFDGDKRMSVVCGTSADGFQWKFRSVIGASDCALDGGDGPSESAVCRLADGRLMCVFRMASCVPYGQTWSADEGRTWSPPVAMNGVFSVEPSLVAMPDGMLALSGGRPGMYVWMDPCGKGESWQAIDMVAHHNRRCPSDPIAGKEFKGTTSYTEIRALDPHTLLLIYDRLASGWSPVADDMKDTNSVWAVKIAIE